MADEKPPLQEDSEVPARHYIYLERSDLQSSKNWGITQVLDCAQPVLAVCGLVPLDEVPDLITELLTTAAKLSSHQKGYPE